MLVLIKISSLINVGNIVKIDWLGLDKRANGQCCREVTHGAVTIMSPDTGGTSGVSTDHNSSGVICVSLIVPRQFYRSKQETQPTDNHHPLGFWGHERDLE